MPHVRTLTRISAIAVLLTCFAAKAEATPLLLGQTLEIGYQFPSIGTTFDSRTVVVGAGTEWSGVLGYVDVNVSDTNILFTFLGSNIFTPSSFGGFRFRDSLGLIPTFTSATLNASSNMTGLTQSRVTFDADQIWVNWQGLSFTPATIVSIDITGAAELSEAPEPATFALLGTGLALIFARRRRSNRA